MKNDILRGDVYWVDFDMIYPEGKHYQRGIRPCIVISNNSNNNCDIVIVVPLTTKRDNLPQHMYINIDGVINYTLPEMMTCMDKKYLLNYKCHVSKEKFEFVIKAVQIQLGIYEVLRRGGSYE